MIGRAIQYGDPGTVVDVRAVPRRVKNVGVYPEVLVHPERIVFSEAEREIVLAGDVRGEMQDEDQPARGEKAKGYSAARTHG